MLYRSLSLSTCAVDITADIFRNWGWMDKALHHLSMGRYCSRSFCPTTGTRLQESENLHHSRTLQAVGLTSSLDRWIKVSATICTLSVDTYFMIFATLTLQQQQQHFPKFLVSVNRHSFIYSRSCFRYPRTIDSGNSTNNVALLGNNHIPPVDSTNNFAAARTYCMDPTIQVLPPWHHRVCVVACKQNQSSVYGLLCRFC